MLAELLLNRLAAAWLELTEGWRSWGRRKQEVVEQPAAVAGPEVLDYAVTR